MLTYWEIVHYIVDFEQLEIDPDRYGPNFLKGLSKDLTTKFGKGFSRSDLVYMRLFYLKFPKGETLSHLLTWSDYFELLKLE
ncbi:MAG: hypothetical protein ACI94D_001027 [Neolewinella sp.]